MAKTARYTEDQVAEALEMARGWPTEAAKLLGFSTAHVRRLVRESERLQEVQAEAREQTLDLAESKLVAAMVGGEPWAIQFYLDRQGQSRGYTKRHDVTQNVKHSGTVEVAVTEVRERIRSRIDGLADRLAATVVPTPPFPTT